MLDEQNNTLADDSVIAIEFVRSFNTLKDIAAGAFANKVIGVDPLTKTQQTKTMNLQTPNSKFKNTKCFQVQKLT